MSPPTAKRCSRDDVNWPNADEFDRCPICDQPTWVTNNEAAISRAEAKKLRRAVEDSRSRRTAFEEYYAKRETKRFRQELSA